jgi:hypothetical protein
MPASMLINLPKNDLLSIHQIPNLAAQQISQITLERLAQITVHPWTKGDKPERIVLKDVFLKPKQKSR